MYIVAKRLDGSRCHCDRPCTLRTVQGTNSLHWVRSVLDTNSPGYERARVRIVQAPKYEYSGIPEYRGVKKLGERQIIHRWNRNDV